MRNSKPAFVPLVAALLVCLVITASGQKARRHGDGYLAGNWKVSLHPYAGPGAESMPLQVVSVEGTAGGRVTWLRQKRLRNRSDKAVVRAAYAAFIYRKEAPEVILFRRQLPSAEAYGGHRLRPGAVWPAPCPEAPEYCPYGKAIFGVAELLAPLVKGGELEGEYLLAIGVTKVWFDDGSVWEFKDEPPPEAAQ